MARLLTDDEIRDALAALPGWELADGRLVKRVTVPADSQPGLREAIRQVADAIDHHPDVAQDAQAMAFTLWTHSAGGVTAKDVDLAARIDRVLSGGGTDTGRTSP